MATKTATKTTKKTAPAKAGTTAAAKKAEPVKAVEPAKAVAPKTAPAKKAEPAKKATVAKKAPAKRTTTKKEIKVSAFVEYFGKQVDEKTIVANVKKAWTKSGKKVGDIKTIELYIKPEEDSVYYVINGTDTGAVGF